MEKTKTVLEKLLRIMFIFCTLLGIIGSVLFFVLHIKNWPTNINYYPEEIILFFDLIVLCLLAIKFKFKYFRWVALAGIILSGINLFGFDVLIKII